MHYVYLIYSRRLNRFYYGQTKDLSRRINDHQRGIVKSTLKSNDWKLVYYEAFLSKKDAIKREYSLKTYGSAVGGVKKRTKNTMMEV